MRRRALPAPSTQTPAARPPPPQAAITSSVMLWTLQGSFEQKIEQAARAGIQSVELAREHVSWTEEDVRRVKRLTRSFRMGIDALAGMPDWKTAPVSMVDPGQREAMLAEAGRNIELAGRLEVPAVILMSGLEIPGRSRREQFDSLVEGARRAGDLAAKAGVKVLLEPLNNKIETPGFFLTTCGEGLRAVREADHPHVRLLFDVYHEQVQAGDLIRSIQAAATYTEIFHVAGHPGRREPAVGEINYPGVYRAIGRSGFKGWIAMEYIPTGDAVKSLIRSVDEMREALARS